MVHEQYYKSLDSWPRTEVTNIINLFCWGGRTMSRPHQHHRFKLSSPWPVLHTFVQSLVPFQAMVIRCLDVTKFLNGLSSKFSVAVIIITAISKIPFSKICSPG